MKEPAALQGSKCERMNADIYSRPDKAEKSVYGTGARWLEARCDRTSRMAVSPKAHTRLRRGKMGTQRMPVHYFCECYHWDATHLLFVLSNVANAVCRMQCDFFFFVILYRTSARLYWTSHVLRAALRAIFISKIMALEKPFFVPVLAKTKHSEERRSHARPINSSAHYS